MTSNMHLLNKSQPSFSFYLSEYPFVINLRFFLLFLPFSDDLQTASFTQDLICFIPFSCVTYLGKPKSFKMFQISVEASLKCKIAGFSSIAKILLPKIYF